MSYTILISDDALKDIKKHKKAGDKNTLKKLNILIAELREHPTYGTGKPEQLRYSDINKWSRRITNKHRLIYTIEKALIKVEIIQAYGHYDDK